MLTLDFTQPLQSFYILLSFFKIVALSFQWQLLYHFTSAECDQHNSLIYNGSKYTYW